MLDFSKVTWDCVHFVNAYRCNEEDVSDCISEFKNLGSVFEINFCNIKTDADLFTEIAKAFSFPDYFGFNWGAFDECLRDLDWLDLGRGVILVANSYKILCTHDIDMLGRLISSWLFCAEEWSKSNVPFHLVLYP